MTLEQLISCCGSSAWANAMYNRQPFADHAALHQSADEVWWALSENDWLEAFSKHPKIGQKSKAKWSAQEQRGMSDASSSVANEMARLNAEYEQRFGFIYIVFATGKSAEEMLQILKSRIANDREQELRVATAEQAKIMHLRLDKLIAE